MRNLKKLLAVVVAICVLATFTVPAFADTKTDAQIATDLGVIKGSGNGVTADYLATTPDRLQGAIMFLRLKGLEDTAKAFVGADNFADVEGLNDTNQAILAYLKANPDLGFAGVGDNKFSPLTKMSAKEYYKVMLVALGYVYETDFQWANTLSFAASKGLTKNIDKDTFTVNDLAIATVEALSTVVKGGTDKLIAKLVDGGSITSAAAVTSGLYSAVAKALEITSATADNFKTAKFVFNKELNSDTVKAANFTGPTVAEAKLLDDKKTVIVVLTDAVTEQSKNVDITVKNVKSADGVTIAETKKTVNFVDTTIPVISGAVAKHAKAIVITVSEPINAVYGYHNFSDLKIDGSAVNASSSTFDYVKNTLTVNLISLLSVGTHKIEVGGLKDYAGYVAVTQTYNFDVAADTTAPSIVSAKVNSPTEIEATFNEDINAKGSFKVNGNDATAGTPDGAKVKLTGFGTLNVGATVEVAIKYKDQTDVVGNKTAETTFTFKVADDTALPTVTASIDADNKITLTFSKDMVKSGTMKIFKEDGTSQIGPNIDLDTAKNGSSVWDPASVCKITATGDLSSTNSKNIKIKLSELKDATVRANALADTTLDLKANDTQAPTAKAYYTVDAKTSDAADDTITFTFSEAMDNDSMKALANYYVTTTAGVYSANKALNAYSDVSFSSVSNDNMSVTFKAKNIAADKPGFSVYGVKDTAGKMMVNPMPVSYIVANNEPTVASANATANNTIVVMFTQDMKTVLPGAFIVADATGTAVAGVGSVAIDGTNPRKVTLTLDQSIGTNADKTYLKVMNKDYAKDYYGVAMTTGGALAGTDTIHATDGIKPTVEFAATPAGITIKFSELVALSGSYTKQNFIDQELMLTKGGDVVTVTTGAIEFSTVDGKTNVNIYGLAQNADYKITLFPKGVIKDTPAGNIFAPTTETLITTKW